MPPDVDDYYAVSSAGHRMYMDPQDARAQAVRRSEGTLGSGSVALWQAVLALRDWDVVVDVGANYGEMLLGSGIPEGARLVCFEPNPRVLPFLRRSIAESGREIDLRDVAVGADEGDASFAVDTVWSGRSGLASTHRTDAQHPLDPVPVQVRSLDSQLLLGDDESVCVKVDVEGGELEVLAGACDVLEGTRPWAVMVEILHMDAFEKARLARDFTMRVMDRRSGDLVVVPPASPQSVETLLEAGWLHAQDAVLTAREAA